MKKLLLISIVFLFLGFNTGTAEIGNSLHKSKTFAANFVGYFMQGGVEYSVWVYLPSTSIAQIKWEVGYSSPSVSGTYDVSNTPTTSVVYTNAFGNTATFVGNLYHY